MNISFFGAAHEVTGSCTLLEFNGKNILIDCGMEQGRDIYENCDLPINPAMIDCLFLTHAHIDHSGKIPFLVKHGFSGQIYTTAATTRLCGIMLMDSAHIQEFEAEWRNRKGKRAGVKPYEPLYTSDDVEAAKKLFVPCSYNKNYNISGDLSIRFIDAGHLLGSASIEITYKENGVQKIILFSGDIGNVDRPLIRDPQNPDKADYVVIESTYGTRLHGERKDYVGQLTKVLQETFDRGGNVVIPSFAVGRTQELLFLIREIKDRGLVKNHNDFPVWIDSPLATETTKIYERDMTEYYDDETLELLKNGIDLLDFVGLNYAVTSEESKGINFDNTPKVIISSSGMCEAGRIRHHIKHNLWRKESTILFVGYQAEGTLGRILLEGTPSVKIFGEEIQNNAHIENMDGISGHGDQKILLNWLGSLKTKPELVFVNHGDDIECDKFAEVIEEKLKFKATAPYNGAVYDLCKNECIVEGNQTKIQRAAKTESISAVFDKLIIAGKKLKAIIAKYKSAPNSEIRKFTAQIERLCNYWDKRE